MDNQPQVGQLDGDDLQLDVTVIEPDPFDAGIEVVGGRVTGVGAAADTVFARRLCELDVLHDPIVSDKLVGPQSPNRPRLRLVRQRRCSPDAGEAGDARPDRGWAQACR